VTFTATDVGGTADQFVVTGNLTTDAAAFAAALTAASAANEFAGGTITFAATTTTPDVSITKSVNGATTDVVAADMTVTTASASAAAVTTGATNVGADTLVLGGVTFTAIASNPVAANGQFVASGNDKTDMASLAQAINAASFAGSSFTAAFDGTTLTISKTTAGVAADVVGGDFALGTAGAGEASLSVIAAPVGDQITIGAGANALTFTAISGAQVAGDLNFTASGNDASDKANLAAAINSADWSGLTNTYAASVNNGILTVTKTVTAGGAGADVAGADFTFTAGTDNADTGKGTGSMAVVAASTSELADLVTQFNTMRTQIDKLAEDSGYKGKNLLSNNTELRSLDVKFEGTTLNVAGFDATTVGLAISDATAGATKWTDSTTKISASITQLDDALSTMRQNSSKLAGNLSIITVRQDFSTNMINTLTAGSDKLTLADANEEGANMLMLQTRQSLSTTALSLSAQAAQSVLRLFQ
jgi:hypothetical protein